MYDFAVKVGGDCLMLIWQHFGKKEVYYIISAGLGEDIIERSLGDMDGFGSISRWVFIWCRISRRQFQWKTL